MEHKKHMERRVKHHVGKAFKIVFIAIFIIGVFLLMGYVLMRLWNWLMPDLFGLTTVGYWQAVGILVLAKLIFGFGTGGSGKKGKPSRKYAKVNKCNGQRIPFEHWKYYDRFWEEEGERAFGNYVERITKTHGGSTQEPLTEAD